MVMGHGYERLSVTVAAMVLFQQAAEGVLLSCIDYLASCVSPATQ